MPRRGPAWTGGRQRGGPDSPAFAERGARTALAEALAAAGLGIAPTTYGRWSSNERAMRNRQALPHTTVLTAVTMSVSAISIEAMVSSSPGRR